MSGRSPDATPAPWSCWSAPTSGRADLAGLQLDQVDTESGRVEVRQGKGRKDRVCWLPPSALPAVSDWLAVRGQAAGPLLQPVRKRGRVEDRALSAQAVRDLCQGLARLAATGPFTPHDLRRTWTGDLLDASGDLAIAQQLAGHASPSTTSRYDRRPEATRRRAAELLHVPYVPPIRLRQLRLSVAQRLVECLACGSPRVSSDAIRRKGEPPRLSHEVIMASGGEGKIPAACRSSRRSQWRS